MDLLLRFSKKIKPYQDKKFLLAVSGGLDSMALAWCFLHLRKIFSVKFDIAYIHHGKTDDPEQEAYRFEAYDFVKNFCKDHSVAFHSNYDGGDKKVLNESIPSGLPSESGLREFRRGQLNKIQAQENLDFIVTAHHLEDLLETRVLRMIRGVGPQGFESIKFIDGQWMRPLIETSKGELAELIESQKGGFVNDPSNNDDQALRNWVRNDWFLSLESRRPGSLKSLARSLDLLLEKVEDQSVAFSCIQGDEIELGDFRTLSQVDQKQALATFMWGLDLKDYGLSHVNEVLKRLDSEQKRYTFQLLHRQWSVDAGRLKVLGLGPN